MSSLHGSRHSRPHTPTLEDGQHNDSSSEEKDESEQISASLRGSIRDFSENGAIASSRNAQPTCFTENFLASEQGSTVDIEKGSSTLQHQSSLKKRNSLSRKGSLRPRSSSRRSRANSVEAETRNSAFYLPVPTQSNPTEILANRFSAWRRVLKDYISYFKEAQVVYEAKAKGIGRLHQSLSAAAEPDMFLKNGGILDTTTVLKDYHKSSLLANEHARQGLSRIITLLTGLRNDLGTKIKEIKGLSGDFKNNLEKERDITRKAIAQLTEALSAADTNPSLVNGKNDPYIVKLSVDRQLRKQLAEENYLHRAYLNLEGSGRELESIVVNEIQKAFESYVKVLRNEGSEILDTAERLELQTLSLPGDHEWSSFVERDPNFVDPRMKIRVFEDIEYPGFKHPAALEVRSGLLERKSKYLKSYTPGWYALSSSHLHEFKTPDRNNDLIPVMSLYLPASTMGSHTDINSSSHKFMIKGRQTGHMHRGHSWVFRADSHQSMMGFYEDIKNLIDLSGAERNAFVASHHRARSSASGKESGSTSSDNGLDNDEADEIPYSAKQDVARYSPTSIREERHEAGRFPSDIDVYRKEHPRSTTSGDSDVSRNGALVTVEAMPYGDTSEEPKGQIATLSTTYYLEHGGTRSSVGFTGEHMDPQQNYQGNERPNFIDDEENRYSEMAPFPATQNAINSQDQTTTTIHAVSKPAGVTTSEEPATHEPLSDKTVPIKPGYQDINSSNYGAVLPLSEPTIHSAPTSASSTFPGITSRTNSNFTISELHVPGEFPKEVCGEGKR